MANTLLTPKTYANTMLKLLKNNLVMGKLVTTEFKNEFKKVGNTVFVKRPPQFNIRDGQIAQVQDVVEGEIPVVMNKYKGIDIEFSSIDRTLTVTDLLNDAIMNAKAAQIAQQIDSDLMATTLEFPSWVGTQGQTVKSATGFFAGPQRLDELAVPGTDRAGILSPADYWALAGAFTGLYAQTSVATNALERAQIPLLGNVQPYMTQSIINLVTGTRVATGSVTVNGAGQNVAYTAINTNDYKQSLNVTGTTGATIKAGEVFTIANVYPVNPRTKAVLPYLAQFVNLADVVIAGGIATLTIANPIITTGAYQTVDSIPANAAAITFLGVASTAYPQNAVFHKSAIALVFARLADPYSGEASYASDPETGVTIRYWRSSDITNDVHLHRWDVLYGIKNLDRRLGTRLSGTP